MRFRIWEKQPASSQIVLVRRQFEGRTAAVERPHGVTMYVWSLSWNPSKSQYGLVVIVELSPQTSTPQVWWFKKMSMLDWHSSSGCHCLWSLSFAHTCVWTQHLFGLGKSEPIGGCVLQGWMMMLPLCSIQGMDRWWCCLCVLSRN